jgi:hypothetical protein
MGVRRRPREKGALARKLKVSILCLKDAAHLLSVSALGQGSAAPPFGCKPELDGITLRLGLEARSIEKERNYFLNQFLIHVAAPSMLSGQRPK